MPSPDKKSASTAHELAIRNIYQVVVQCRDERDQKSLYTKLRKAGYSCRLLTLW